MKTVDLLSMLRTDILDDTEQPFLWSDLYLLQCLSESEREAARRAYLLLERSKITAADTNSGTATSTTANKLIDSAAVFVTGQVSGKTVYNLTKNTSTVVTSFVSGTNLDIADDIMVSGDRYVIGDPAEALTRINVVAGTSDYALSSKVIKICESPLPRILSASTHLIKKTASWLDDNYYEWRTATGTPRYYVEGKGYIKIVPTPDANLNNGTGKDALVFESYRLPISDLSTGTPTVNPEIASEYHMGLLDRAAHNAYLKPDSEGQDQSKANTHEALFTRKFGPSVSALEEENRRALPALFKLDGPRFQ